MHKKILLCLNRNQFESFDYNIDYTKAMNLLGKNSGNNVFQYSLQKLLTNGKNEINVDTLFLLHSTKFDAEIDYINSEYDCLVFSPANLISKYASEKLLIKLTERINKLKIPVYAIGLGAQSDRNYSLNYLKNIRNPFIEKDLENRIKNFISLSLEERLQLQQNQFENLKKEINPNKSILPRFDLKKNKHCQQEVKISNFLEEKVCNMHF